jgi:hypothetical protein
MIIKVVHLQHNALIKIELFPLQLLQEIGLVLFATPVFATPVSRHRMPTLCP